MLIHWDKQLIFYLLQTLRTRTVAFQPALAQRAVLQCCSALASSVTRSMMFVFRKYVRILETWSHSGNMFELGAYSYTYSPKAGHYYMLRSTHGGLHV